MANEFKISSKIDLNASEATTVWNKFKSDAEKLKNIDIKVKVQGLEGITKEMTNLLELVNKVNSAQAKMNTKSISSNANNSELKKQAEYLQKYKDTYRTIEKLKQQQSKGINDSSFGRIGKEIDSLTKDLTKYKSLMNDTTKLKIKPFEDIQSNSALVKMEKSITDVANKAEKLQTSFKGIDFKNVDTGQFTSSMDKALQKVEELQSKSTKGIDIHIELNNAINELNKLENQMKQLKELDSIKGSFENIESSIKDSFGVEVIERFRLEIEQLQSSVMQTDGTFDRLASGMRSSLSTASSDMRRMNTELRSSSRFMSDFTGSFASYTLGNVVGDGIVRGIRGVKDAFLDMDKAMTNVKKVADPIDINTTGKLDNIRQTAITTAKDVGQSSADVMNAMADTLQAGIGITI